MKNLPGVGNHLVRPFLFVYLFPLTSCPIHQQDHIAVPLQYRVPMKDSIVKLQLQPWIIIKEIILYLLFGTGLLLAPVLELSIFAHSRLLNNKFEQNAAPKERDASLPENLPDIEIMPVRSCHLLYSCQ